MPMDPALRDDAMQRISEAARLAFDDQVQAIILKGSALTEEFIPGYSDLDVHVYVPGTYLLGPRTPRLEPAVRFQSEIGDLDPAAFGASSFQIYFVDAAHYPEDWSKPLRGTYEVVYGGPVDDVMPSEEFLRRSWAHLETIPASVAMLLGRFVDKTNAELSTLVRLAGVFLKGFVYSAAAVVRDNPDGVKGRSVQGLLRVLGEGGVAASPAEAFFSMVAEWDVLKENPERCREAFRLAIKAMQNIGEWAAGGDEPATH